MDNRGEAKTTWAQVANEMMDGGPEGKVYVMHHRRTDLYKIGKSIDPGRREKTLQSEDPGVELVWCCQERYVSEAVLHNEFRHKRARGEWFELDEEDLIRIVTLQVGCP